MKEHIDNLLTTYKYKRLQVPDQPESQFVPTRLEQYYIGKTYYQQHEPARWNFHKKTYDIMLVMYETQDEGDALSTEQILIEHKRGDPRLQNKREGGGGGTVDPDTHPNTTFVVYMCLKYQNIYGHYVELEKRSQSLSMHPQGSNPRRRKALDSLRAEIDKILMETNISKISIGIISQQEYSCSQEEHEYLKLYGFHSVYILAEVGEECIPVEARETLHKNRKNLLVRYTLSLQQELVNHYLFEEPNNKMIPRQFLIKSTREETWHTRYKLVVYIQYAEDS